MKKQTIHITIIFAITLLFGCAGPDKKSTLGPVSKTTTLEKPKNEPPSVVLKGDQPLELVRIMDGGACKNKQQGVQGEFLLYADQLDIERIRREAGDKAFVDFEHKIESIAMTAFEQTVINLDFSKDPFASGKQAAQQKLADQFKQAIDRPIKQFQQDSTLTIDIEAFPSSLRFYYKGCNTNEMGFPAAP